MKKTLLILGILIVFSAATAQAGLNFGVKSLSLSETDLSSLYFISMPQVHTNQSLGCYFGIDVSSQVVILAGLDFTRARIKEQDTPGFVNPTDVYEFGYTSFTPHVGAKFYLKPINPGDIAPYLQAGFFKTFTSATYESPWNTPAENDFEEEMWKEIMAPYGFYLAFGVEYFFSGNFSLGGETGVRFSFAKAEATLAGTTDKIELNNDYIAKYIGITLNYFFGER